MRIEVAARVRKQGDDPLFVRCLRLHFEERSLAVAHRDALRVVDEPLVPREGDLHETVTAQVCVLAQRPVGGICRKPDRRLALVPFDGRFNVINCGIAENIFLEIHSASQNTGRYAVPPRQNR